MSKATVKYIANGFTVTQFGNATIPESIYAATIPEVVYWIGRLFEPLAPAAAMAGNVTPRTIINNDPLLNRTADVETMGSGGYLVRQLPGGALVTQAVDTYAVNMDAVSDLLTQIFTATPEA